MKNFQVARLECLPPCNFTRYFLMCKVCTVINISAYCRPMSNDYKKYCKITTHYKTHKKAGCCQLEHLTVTIVLYLLYGSAYYTMEDTYY